MKKLLLFFSLLSVSHHAHGSYNGTYKSKIEKNIDNLEDLFKETNADSKKIQQVIDSISIQLNSYKNTDDLKKVDTLLKKMNEAKNPTELQKKTKNNLYTQYINRSIDVLVYSDSSEIHANKNIAKKYIAVFGALLAGHAYYQYRNNKTKKEDEKDSKIKNKVKSLKGNVEHSKIKNEIILLTDYLKKLSKKPIKHKKAIAGLTIALAFAAFSKERDPHLISLGLFGTQKAWIAHYIKYPVELTIWSLLRLLAIPYKIVMC